KKTFKKTCQFITKMAVETTTESIITINPFLDPFSTPPGGRLSQVGQPLNSLHIPPIQTLIRKVSGETGTLTLVNVDEILSRVTPRENFVVRDENVGIETNLSLFGAAMTA